MATLTVVVDDTLLAFYNQNKTAELTAEQYCTMLFNRSVGQTVKQAKGKLLNAQLTAADPVEVAKELIDPAKPA